MEDSSYRLKLGRKGQWTEAFQEQTSISSEEGLGDKYLGQAGLPALLEGPPVLSFQGQFLGFQALKRY